MLLSIIDIIKTIGMMGIPLRGHREDSKYHPDTGEPSGHDGLGNFVELVSLTIRQRNASLEKHLKTCSSREAYVSKTTQNILLNWYSMPSQRQLLKELLMLSISLFYAMKHQIHQIKSNCLFV